MERVFAQQNSHTVMGTAQASGVALLIAAEHGLPAATHTPSEVKASVTGYGSADKKQVQAMIARIPASTLRRSRPTRRTLSRSPSPRLAWAWPIGRRGRERRADAGAEGVGRCGACRSNIPTSTCVDCSHDLLLRGTVLSATTDSVIVEVGGVGFSVSVPGDVAHTARVGHELRLHTSLIVREDALSLYGFADVAELEVFGHLVGHGSGAEIRPRGALASLFGKLNVEQTLMLTRQSSGDACLG